MSICSDEPIRRQGRYWLLTIPEDSFRRSVDAPIGCAYLKGQLEIGKSGGFRHWQLLAVLTKKGSLGVIKSIFGDGCHAELSRSSAADVYVWKDDTSVPGTRFECGTKPIRRASAIDWDRVWTDAVDGNILAVPAQIRVSSYRTLKSIATDFAEPIGMERTAYVFWGATGSGKSRRAWEEAGVGAYPKDPRTKFWCGYNAHEHVVIDEFRGGIDVGHLLRWLDRYPVIVETKGGGVVLAATTVWLTSNISPELWYPDLDAETFLALKRRLKVTHFV